MNIAPATPIRNRKQRPLTVALILAGGLSAGAVSSTALAATVANCFDDGSPGSLRGTIAAAASGDTVDIPVALGCSTITLTTGSPAIPINVDDLAIDGHGALTIDGGKYYGRTGSILYHLGVGTLKIYGTTLQSAEYKGNAHPDGGCIYSRGNVYLGYSTVQNCRIQESTPAPTTVRGGAIFAEGEVTLVYSKVIDNSIFPSTPNNGVAGGGIYSANGFYSSYCTIANNYAGGHSFGGGIFTRGYGDTIIRGSTISGNQAYAMGGLSVYGPPSAHTTTIVNSTLSGNRATLLAAGALTLQPAYVFNSTIAFNRTTVAYVAGFYANSTLVLQSSILANNFGNDGSGGIEEDDLFAYLPTGSNNIVVASPVALPAGTSHACPLLGPLADNGGLTQTHALAKNSPAIDAGNDLAGLYFDQRGNGFARESPSGKPDIGAFERQPADAGDFIFSGEFEGRCD